MVEFKTLKFKHYRKAKKLHAKEIAGEDVDEEYLAFAVSMVSSWDFTDGDTKDKLPVNKDTMEELSLDQVKEISVLFNRSFGEVGAVPKTNAEPSPSTSTPSSQTESPATVQSG